MDLVQLVRTFGIFNSNSIRFRIPSELDCVCYFYSSDNIWFFLYNPRSFNFPLSSFFVFSLLIYTILVLSDLTWHAEYFASTGFSIHEPGYVYIHIWPRKEKEACYDSHLFVCLVFLHFFLQSVLNFFVNLSLFILSISVSPSHHISDSDRTF